MAEIAEAVVIRVGNDRRLKPNAIKRDQIGNARRMDTQRQDHRRRLRAIIGYLVAGANFHQNISSAHLCHWAR